MLKRNNKNDTDTYCEYLVRGVLISIFFDLFYLFLIGDEFRLSRVQNKVSSFLSFIFSILNLVGKVILGYLIWVRNTKMKMMRESETDKILKNEYLYFVLVQYQINFHYNLFQSQDYI